MNGRAWLRSTMAQCLAIPPCIFAECAYAPLSVRSKNRSPGLTGRSVSAIVFSSRKAARATRALNAGLWMRRVNRADALSIDTSSHEAFISRA